MLSSIVFKEPLSDEGEKRKRALLLVACLAILVASYGVEAKIPWLDIESKGVPNILEGALAVALLYTFCSFVIYAWADLSRWFAAGTILHVHSYFDVMLTTRQHLNAISQWIGKPLAEFPSTREGVKKIHADAVNFTDRLQQVIDDARQSHRKLTLMQSVKLFWEVGGPLLLAVFAMFKIGAALIPFLSVLFRA